MRLPPTIERQQVLAISELNTGHHDLAILRLRCGWTARCATSPAKALKGFILTRVRN